MSSRPRVLTIGTFDCPHIGHAILFKNCEKLGELTVGVNTDEFVKNYKGHAPLFTLSERKQLIEDMGYETRLNREAGQDLIKSVKPDYLVIGSDWATKDYHRQLNVTQRLLDVLGITLVYAPYTEGISTSEIKRRCGLLDNSS